MKIWIYKIYINLPTGRSLVRTVRIAAENEEKKINYLTFGILLQIEKN